jgi:hypothetical protein
MPVLEPVSVYIERTTFKKCMLSPYLFTLYHLVSKLNKVFRLIDEFSVWPVVFSLYEPSPQPLMGCWVLFEFDYEFMKVFVILEPFYLGKVVLSVSSLSWSFKTSFIV